VASLVGACRRRGRVPRLEYFPALAPEVAPRLLAAGFAEEGRLALMTCTPDELREVAAPRGFAVAIAAGDDEFLAAAVAQHEAYAEPEPGGVAVREPFRRRGLAAALTHHLTAAAFASGATTAFLTPIGPAEARIYHRTGYTQVADQLHISPRPQP
jgi:GNAT superfamily N-acetyltransferase